MVFSETWSTVTGTAGFAAGPCFCFEHETRGSSPTAAARTPAKITLPFVSLLQRMVDISFSPSKRSSPDLTARDDDNAFFSDSSLL
jgi:hypothetical protein